MPTLDTLEDVQVALRHLLNSDASLFEISNIAGPLPLRRTAPGFESLASIVVSQQVSKASADAIFARLVTLGAVTDATQFARFGDESLLGAGLSRPKLKTLRLVSSACIDGTLDLEGLCTLSAGDAISALTALPGIGPWTAEVYLLFAAGHPDIFPSGDIALQNAIQMAQSLEARPNAKKTHGIALRWAPHRGTAARLFWVYYGAIKGMASKSPL